MDSRLGGMAGFQDLTRRAKRADLRLSELRHEYQVQRDRLASAMGLSPDVCIDGGFYVVGELSYPRLPVDIPTLEMQAVQNRPEAFQAGLNHLNAINDVKRTIVKYCPKITGFWKWTRDKDKYIQHHDWNEVGVMVYFDLVDWLSNHFENRATRAAAGKTTEEMGAIALGISSQVRRAANNYYFAEERLQNSDVSLKRTRRDFAITEQRLRQEDVRKTAVREARANVLEDRVDRLDALGRAHAALAELFSQTGTNYREPPPGR
jgi:outer membrane protein TolC